MNDIDVLWELTALSQRVRPLVVDGKVKKDELERLKEMTDALYLASLERAPIDVFLDKVWCCRAETLQPLMPDHSVDLVLADALYFVGMRYQWGNEPRGADAMEDVLLPLYEDWFRLLRPGGHVVLFAANTSSANDEGEVFRYQSEFRRWFGEYSTACLVKHCTLGPQRIAHCDKAIVQTAERKRPNVDHEHLICDAHFGLLDDYVPHECQKPLAGVKWLLDLLTEEGDVVFDPFCGSGTTAVACKVMGRRFVCGDLWPRYCRYALERLAFVEAGVSPYVGRDGSFKGERRYFYWHGGEVPT